MSFQTSQISNNVVNDSQMSHQCIIEQQTPKNESNKGTVNDFTPVYEELIKIQTQHQSQQAMIGDIKQYLRDTCNAIISTQIHAYNGKSSKEDKNCQEYSQLLQQQGISSCLLNISQKIIYNYTKSLNFLILNQIKNSKHQKKPNQCFSEELQKFMAKFVQFTKLKYLNLGDDDDGYQVLPSKELKKCVSLLQDFIVDDERSDYNVQIAKNSFDFQNKQNKSKENAKNNTNLDEIGLLNSELAFFKKQIQQSFPKYKQIMNKISPSIRFTSKQELSQLLNKVETKIQDSFQKLNSNFLLKLMVGMIKVAKSEKKTRIQSLNKRRFNVSSFKRMDLEQDRENKNKETKNTIRNALQQRNFNNQSNKGANTVQKSNSNKTDNFKKLKPQLVSSFNQDALAKQTNFDTNKNKQQTQQTNFHFAAYKSQNKPHCQNFTDFYIQRYFYQSYETRVNRPNLGAQLQIQKIGLNKIQGLYQIQSSQKKKMQQILKGYSAQVWENVRKQLSLEIQQLVQILKLTQKHQDNSQQKTIQSNPGLFYSNVLRSIESQALSQSISLYDAFQSFQQQENSAEKPQNLADLIKSQIQCNNQNFCDILQQIYHLTTNQEIQILKICDNLRTKNKNSLTIWFKSKSVSERKPSNIKVHQAPKKQAQFLTHFCRLDIRLDQKSDTPLILRQNYQRLYDFLDSLSKSQFGIIGELTQYYLSVLQTKLT